MFVYYETLVIEHKKLTIPIMTSIWVYLRENPELAPNPTVIIWAVLVLEVIQKMVAQIKGSLEEGKTLNQRPTIMVLGALVDQLERGDRKSVV